MPFTVHNKLFFFIKSPTAKTTSLQVVFVFFAIVGNTLFIFVARFSCKTDRKWKKTG